ncbi:hypothetical protein PPSIR1_18372 [Plesiocystis pacifica SIR-1]|uniref:Uncharacterized protein n=1 Tax=Plesiocystis pacifica SIR-1 TaxID=391625 RepID=A6GBY9_9BACT|nr:hypothetical protein [Plesiocystis pacifica]EDM76662.1 hypothetical protein PPSIR1_18372 [Plesiocystis pacifica SIR-1]
MTAPEPKDSRSPWLALLAVPAVVVVALAVLEARDSAPPPALEPEVATVSAAPLQPADEASLAPFVAQLWAEARSGEGSEGLSLDGLPARLSEPAQPVYVALRVNGLRLHQLWLTPEEAPEAANVASLLAEALRRAAKAVDDPGRVTTLEIDLSHSFRVHDWSKEDERALLLDSDRHRAPHYMGVRGLRVQLGERTLLVAPSRQVTTNRRVNQQLAKLRKDWGVDEAALAKARFETFEADQLLVLLEGREDPSAPEAVVMLRGNELVELDAVDAAGARALAEGMAWWLTRNVDRDGALTYAYYPSSGKRSAKNNMIRQWMATNALNRWGDFVADPDERARIHALARRNIDHNLRAFYSTTAVDTGAGPEVHGLIEHDGQVKLGALALAGMALWTHPERARWSAEIASLRRSIDHLFDAETGTFRSFYRGSDGEVYNFYPGEAMLWWALIYAEEGDPELLRQYTAAFEYYRRWHLEPKNRHPAFVPWHLQANVILWRALGRGGGSAKTEALREELASFSLEIADWLVETQQWGPESGVVVPDERGRFYVPTEGYGVPHASATGVYIEGLVEAWSLADRLGDEERKARYALSLRRAIRSIMQLQFVDEVDLFYVSKREAVRGGVRTAVYDNAIRCDNVQHALMGVLVVLRRFDDADFEG